MSQSSPSEAINSPSTQPAPGPEKILAPGTPSPPASPAQREQNVEEEEDVEMELESIEKTANNEEEEVTSDEESEAEGVKVVQPTAISVTPGSNIDKLKDVKFHKIKRDESEDAPSPSQVVRKMKVDKALHRYQKFKSIHEKALKSFKDFQEERKKDEEPDDFDGELDLMMAALSLSHQALKKRETKLNEAITDGQDEIEIVPFRNPMPQYLESKPQPKATKVNRTRSSKGVKRYLDLEAGVSEKEVEAEGCGGRKRRKREYKSDEFVVDDIPLGDHDTTDDDDSSSGDDEDIKGPDAIEVVQEVVLAQDAIKKDKVPSKKNEKIAEPPIAELPVSKDSIFHNADTIMDLTKLLKNPTEAESEFLSKASGTLTHNTFDWGESLKESVVQVISCWKYHANSQLGQPTQDTIQPLVLLMKRTVEGREIKKQIETCPRLIQIATTDPYLTEDSINWPLIQESTRYPWKERNRIFRAFHSMACRTGKDLVWTPEKDIKNKIRTAHKTLHKY
ncbi:hypothetical protein DFH28DRAFT_940248 [Melampsora americana]|nr:hypothetical protein DFH28DRAFT_940248 [Melampsora americana]